MTELDPTPLKGTVEVEETFVGGKLKGHGTGRGAYLLVDLPMSVPMNTQTKSALRRIIVSKLRVL